MFPVKTVSYRSKCSCSSVDRDEILRGFLGIVGRAGQLENSLSIVILADHNERHTTITTGCSR